MALILSTPREDLETGLFVRIDVENYRQYVGGPATTEVLTFSNYHREIVIGGENYLPFGNLVNITSLDAQVKASAAPVTISISGIPSSSVKEVVASDIKGSEVRVYRAMIDPADGSLITASPVGRFTGFVNNYSINDEWDDESQTAYNSVDLYCTSTIEFLENVVRSRKTNPDSYRDYADDPSFDNIPSLENSTFNFGAPK
jgi:hypothetical protein